MAVTSPVVTVSDIKRNAGSLTAGSDALANAWGALYTISPADSSMHDEVLILHSPDDGTSTWNTDTYTIEFSATNSSQTRKDWKISKIFNNHDIPTQETTWDSSDTETIDFDSGDLDNDPDKHVQGITGVAILDEAEWEPKPEPDIFGFKTMIIDAMPKVTTANTGTTFSFSNDEFSVSFGDFNKTVDVTLAHENLDDAGTPLYAELFNGAGTSQATYSTNPFSVTITDGYYLLLYIEMPYDNNYTDGSPVAVRRIDMTTNN